MENPYFNGLFAVIYIVKAKEEFVYQDEAKIFISEKMDAGKVDILNTRDWIKKQSTDMFMVQVMQMLRIS